MNVDLRALKSMLKKIYAMGVIESIFTIGENKLFTRCVDPAHICMVELTLKIKNCDIKPILFGLELDSFIKRVINLPLGKKSKKEDRENTLKIHLAMNHGEVSHLRCKHPMLSFNNITSDIKGVVASKYPKTIEERISATATINKYQLKIFLKIAEQETDHIAFIADAKKKKLIAEYINDKEERVFTDLTYSLGGIEGLDLTFLNKNSDEIKSLFSIDYMLTIISPLMAPTIKIGMQNDSPLVIWWEEEYLSGTYLLAPRIESD